MKKIYLLLLVLFSFFEMKAQQNCTITYSYDSLTTTYFFSMTPNSTSSSFTWDFGDGTTSNQFGSVASHVYQQAGPVVICVTEIDTTTSNVLSNCCTSLVTQPNSQCSFTYTQPDPSNDAIVHFQSSGTPGQNITWDFGDGTTGLGYAPQHIYTSSGVFTVCMTITTFLDTCTACIAVVVLNTGPTPCSFTYTTDTVAPFTAQFDFTTSGSGWTNTVTWDFGDGNTATGSSVTHTYGSIGNYTACVTETDSAGNILCQVCNPVQISPVTNCSFYFSPAGGPLNSYYFEANFDSTLYYGQWDFGDGTIINGGPTSQHTFVTPGIYIVCLNVIDNITQNILCSFCMPIPALGPPACEANFTTVPFGLDAYFIDYSSADPAVTTYTWDFGDGSPADTSRFPIHTYGTPGTYNVCLAIQNSTCADTTCQTIIVDSTIIAPVSCTSYFIFTQLSPYSLAVVNLSSGTNLSFFWDFGDGLTSTAAYPIHSYPNTGTYQICLTVSDATGCTNTYCDSLTVDSTGMIIYRSSNVGFMINVVSPTQLHTVSVEETPSLISNIFPNPSKDRIVVTSTATSGVAIYSILSVSNQKMKQGRLSGEKSEIDISDLASGIYFLEVKNKAGEKSFARFIKE